MLAKHSQEWLCYGNTERWQKFTVDPSADGSVP